MQYVGLKNRMEKKQKLKKDCLKSPEIETACVKKSKQNSKQ